MKSIGIRTCAAKTAAVVFPEPPFPRKVTNFVEVSLLELASITKRRAFLTLLLLLNLGCGTFKLGIEESEYGRNTGD